MSVIAAFRNVSVTVQGRVVLEDISVSFMENEFSVIFGPNGAGKSTLLKLLVNQITPSSGSVSIYGKEVKAGLDKIGYVPQDFFSKKDFPISVLKAVLTGRYGKIGWLRKPTSDDYAIAEEVLDLVGLSSLSQRNLNELSGGELQRVFLARALANKPKLLLLDEAASGVDVGAKESLYDLLIKLKREMAIVFVSHDMSVVSKGVDMVCCLDKRLVSHGSPEVALTNEALTCMYGHQIATFSHCSTPHMHVHSHEDK